MYLSYLYYQFILLEYSINSVFDDKLNEMING